MKLAVLLLAAGFALAAPQSENGRQLCSIQGTVTNAVTKEPLRKAYVHLTGLKTYPAVTDDQGKFSFVGIEPGAYSMEAERPGFVVAEFTDAFGAMVQLKLAPGQTLNGLEIKMTPQAVVTGRVVDEDGDPWPHGGVALLRSVWEKGHRRLENTEGTKDLNDQGEFRAAELNPGTYYLTAEPDSDWEARNIPKTADLQPHQVTWYPSSPDATGATAITVGPGDQISGLVIRLRRGGEHRIRGVLLGLANIPPASTGPFSGTGVFASTSGGEGGVGRNGAIHSDGSFEIDHLPPGTYDINVWQGFYRMRLGSAQVRVDDQDADNVSIQLTPPQTIRGAVQVAEPGSMQPGGVLVMLDPLGTPGEPNAVSNEDGSFELPSVGIDKYRVVLGGRPGRGYYLKQVFYGDTVSTDGTISIPGAGGDLVLLVSTRGAHLSGTVKRSADQPADPAFPPQVVLIPKDARTPQLAVFDQTGVFSFENQLAPGDYKLYAFEGAPDGAWEDAEFLKEVASSGIDIHLAEGDSKTTEVPLLTRADLARSFASSGWSEATPLPRAGAPIAERAVLPRPPATEY